MGKAVMISIRPKWCQKIADGEKTIEIRKTRPRLETPFKCYIYCTQGGVALGMWGKHGKVIGEFTCDRIDTLARIGYTGSYEKSRYHVCTDDFRPKLATEDFLNACLAETEAEEYLRGRTGYGWHISDLVIYNTPKELSKFWFPPELYCERERCGGCPYDQVADVNGEYSYDCEWKRPLTRPPQSWSYVEEL